VAENAILVPLRAVQEIQGAKSVLVVGPDNVVALRTITPVQAVGEFLIVRDGVKPGDRVIVDGIQKARPGSTVNPSTAAAGGQAGAKTQDEAKGKPAEATPPGKAERK
jgi:membrane fusion protein (multidrug efflux system)